MYIETRRLTVRRMEESDFPDALEYMGDPELCRMMGTWCPKDEREAREAFEWLMNHEKRFYAIVLRSENKCVGHLIVNNFPVVGAPTGLSGLEGRSLSFCVASPYRRRGYASEAVGAAVDYLFERRGVGYVNSGYFTFNEPSRRLHKKLGFVPVTTTAVPLPGGEIATGVETVKMNPAVRRRPEAVASEK